MSLSVAEPLRRCQTAPVQRKVGVHAAFGERMDSGEHEKQIVGDTLCAAAVRPLELIGHGFAFRGEVSPSTIAEGEGGNTPSLDARLLKRGVAPRRLRPVARSHNYPLAQQRARQSALLICGPAVGPELPDARRHAGPVDRFPDQPCFIGLHAVAPARRGHQ